MARLEQGLKAWSSCGNLGEEIQRQISLLLELDDFFRYVTYRHLEIMGAMKTAALQHRLESKQLISHCSAAMPAC